MSIKIFWLGSLIAVLIGFIAALTIGIEPVRAQCGETEPSSCITCHEQAAPVSESGEWHIIHADKDICMNCHGGNGTTMDKDPAHEGMNAHPLEDIYTDCHSCHPDYDERAERFAPTLGVTPGSCATPTPVPVNHIADQLPPSGIVEETGVAITAKTILAIVTGLFMLVLFCAGLGWLEKHHVAG